MKKIVLIMTIATIGFGIIGCSNNDQPNNNQQNNIQSETNQSNDTTITVEKAKEIALKHANLTENQVKFTKVELDDDNGVQEYDVEFYYNNTEYNYEINAQTGEIISHEKN